MRPEITIPDYALDKHTQRGYEMHRMEEHFIAEGAKLIQPDAAQIATSEKDYQGKAEANLRTGRKKIKTPEEELEDSEAPHKDPF
jgi:hypothetical protein